MALLRRVLGLPGVRAAAIANALPAAAPFEPYLPARRATRVDPAVTLRCE